MQSWLGKGCDKISPPPQSGSGGGTLGFHLVATAVAFVPWHRAGVLYSEPGVVLWHLGSEPSV